MRGQQIAPGKPLFVSEKKANPKVRSPTSLLILSLHLDASWGGKSDADVYLSSQTSTSSPQLRLLCRLLYGAPYQSKTLGN